VLDLPVSCIVAICPSSPIPNALIDRLRKWPQSIIPQASNCPVQRAKPHFNHAPCTLLQFQVPGTFKVSTASAVSAAAASCACVVACGFAGDDDDQRLPLSDELWDNPAKNEC
jgi:hypothetical protein